MSLINDALKRVKEAQHQAPPSASLGPQLRPVEPVPAPRHSLGLLLPLALVGVALLTLLFVWELAKKDNSSGPVANRAQATVQEQPASREDSARSVGGSSETALPSGSSIHEMSPARVVTSSAGVPIQLTSGTPSNSAPSASVTNSATAAQVKASLIAETAVTNSESTLQTPSPLTPDGNTNSATVAEAQPPKPPPLKLQGIVFSQRPSAVISGKTLFVGDRIREFRVFAITQDTALLVGGGRTNVLSLSE